MKPPLTQQDIVDRAARRARRWLWFKIVILILVVLLILDWLVLG
jgi:hypothetical protein